MTYKSGTTSFSSGSSNKYGGFGSSGDRFSDSYGDKGRYDEAKVDKDYSGKSRYGVSSKNEENSFKKGSARSVRYGVQMMVNVFYACSVVPYYSWIVLPCIILGKYESGVSSDHFSSSTYNIDIVITTCIVMYIVFWCTLLVTVCLVVPQVFKLVKPFTKELGKLLCFWIKTCS